MCLYIASCSKAAFGTFFFSFRRSLYCFRFSCCSSAVAYASSSLLSFSNLCHRFSFFIDFYCSFFFFSPILEAQLVERPVFFFFFNTPSKKKKKRGVLSLSIVEVHFKRALFVFLCVFFFRLRAAGFKRARECELFYQSWVSRASVRVLKRHLYCHVRLSVSPFFFLFVFLLFLKSFFFLVSTCSFFFFIISGLRSCGEERARLRYIGRNRKRKKEHHFSFFCCTK